MRFFAIFIPYESILGVDDRSEIFFQYLKGRCHGNKFCLVPDLFAFSDILRDVAMATNLVAKMGQNYLRPPALIALSIQNGMGYRYINRRVNSASDASISCKNFVNFGPVTPEKTGLICILFYDMAKNWHI